MTISEGKTLTTCTVTPRPIDPRDLEATLEQEKQLEEIFNPGKRDSAPVTIPAPAPMTRKTRKVWKGTVTDFALKIEADFTRGKIKATSVKAALEQACKLYERHDGRRFSAHSLQSLLYQRHEILRGK